jgi:hypothetical protein
MGNDLTYAGPSLSDSELEVLVLATRLLDNLDANGAGRVVTYLGHRFGVMMFGPKPT